MAGREGRQDRQDGRRAIVRSRGCRDGIGTKRSCRVLRVNSLSLVHSLARALEDTQSPDARVALKRLRNALSSGVTALRRHRRATTFLGRRVGGPLRAPYFANIMRLRSPGPLGSLAKECEVGARYLWNAGH